MGRTVETDLQKVNDEFVEKMWQLEPGDINKLKTLVLWEFSLVADSEQRLFFIKNLLFTSNYREKIEGRLRFGRHTQYIQEIDTGESIERRDDGSFTQESSRKILEKVQELGKEQLFF